MDVSLVMFKADGTRRDFPVAKQRVVVGRKPDCDLRIPLSSVSRQHCEIRLDGEQLHVRDLGSSNGTYHNNVRVQEAVLSPGDHIVIGPVVFTVVINGEPEHILPVHSDMNSDSGATSSATVASEHAPIREVTQKDVAPSEPAKDVPSPDAEIEDPIAALERLAEMENEDSSGASDEFYLLPDDDDDDRA